jgi:hypothetical protein
MTAAAVGFVLHFGRNAPWADEWEMVPGLVNDTPLGPWLWAQHNEHRLPLPRLVWWALFQLTRDFRAGTLAQVTVLAAAALGLMRLAARLRGRPSVADLFFPAGLLHWGHVENLVMGYQVNFALTLAGVVGLLALAATVVPATRGRTGVAAGVVLILLELTGGSGLMYVPAVGGWLLWLAAAEWRAGRRGTAVGIIGLVAAAVGYVGVYLVGYHRPATHPPPAWGDPGRIGAVFAQVLAMAFGGGAIPAWPAAAAGTTAAAAVTLTRRSPMGLLAVLGGVLTLAAAIAVGRSGFSSPYIGLWSRYAVLVWPALAAGYLAAVAAGRGWVTAALCGGMLAALPANTLFGWQWATGYASEMDRLEADVRAGLPPAEVIRRGRYLSEIDRDEQIAHGIRRLKETGFGYFAGAAVP